MTGMNGLLWVLIWSAMVCYTQGARILGLFPFPAKSHKAIFSTLLRELASRGHDVVIYSPYPENPPVANLTDVLMIELDYRDHKLPRNLFGLRGAAAYMRPHWEMGICITEAYFNDPVVDQLLTSKEHFDLVLIEAFFNEAFLGFAHKFKAPVIELSSIHGAVWVYDWFANPATYSYVPNNYVPYGDKMDFVERFWNAYVGSYIRFWRWLYYLPAQEEILSKHFGLFDGLPSVADMERNVSLIFLNQHFTLTPPRPFMPNMIPVAGMQIKTPPKKLPEDLQKFMDEATEGVIYFSMGTHLPSYILPQFHRTSLIDAFSKLKQKILWKWEKDVLPGKPENVKIAKYLPQFSLLHHPNLKAFMTHCGVSSTQEAAYVGVPIIGLPIFGDQVHNCKGAERAGFGVVLTYEEVTSDAIVSAVEKVLQPSYLENAQRMSRAFRDQPLKPLEQAVYWTEYVIRHKGAPHMRSAALELTWYEYFLLDVIAVLALAVGIVLLVIILIVRTIFKTFCGRKRPNISKKLK